MYARKISLVIAAVLAPVSVFASTECTKEPVGKWLTEKEVKTRVESTGFTVHRIKRDNSCYEIKGARRDGKRVGLYVNPVDASVVKEER